MAGITPTGRDRLLSEMKRPAELFRWARQADFATLAASQRKAVEALRNFDFAQVDAEIALAAQHGATILTPVDEHYPAVLFKIDGPPPFLEILGDITCLHRAPAAALAVVGSRNATAYGEMVSASLVAPLAKVGCLIVSGGARGIDAAAHRVCLSSGGQTLAVVGSGLGQPYPANHRELFAAIARSGCVISEHAWRRKAEAYFFPQRNRLIAGLTSAVLVVEAALKSGALITARLALEQGKEVMAVPGPINQKSSEGTNRLIQEGAFLVRSAADIACLLKVNLPQVPVKKLSTLEAKALESLGGHAMGRQSIINMLDLAPAEASQLILGLEEKGLLLRLAGERWIRSLEGCESLWHLR